MRHAPAPERLLVSHCGEGGRRHLFWVGLVLELCSCLVFPVGQFAGEDEEEAVGVKWRPWS